MEYIKLPTVVQLA